MKDMTMRFPVISSKTGALAWLMTLGVVLCTAGRANATISNAQFNLKINEKALLLEHPHDMDMMMFAMWDVAFQRVADRNMPCIELENDPLSDAPITELHMTIGDTRFNFSDDYFGDYAFFSEPPTLEISSGVADNGDELVLNFGDGGLQPGELIRFRIDLDVDPEWADLFYMHPDFRTVLFDMNGKNVYDGNLIDPDVEDNSKVTTLFESDGMSLEVMGQFDDYIVNDSSSFFYNEHFRTYGVMEPANTFPVSGVATEVIPEPGSLLLTSLACIGGWFTVRRHRRRC